jgi:hypothetical protein
MKNFVQKNGGWILAFLWFLMIGIIAVMFTSCNQKPKIENGDLVIKCVVDSVWVKKSPSTLDIEPSWYIKTSCGEIHKVNKIHPYHIGDTITYVYKKK